MRGRLVENLPSGGAFAIADLGRLSLNVGGVGKSKSLDLIRALVAALFLQTQYRWTV
jgi:hypothetical protein